MPLLEVIINRERLFPSNWIASRAKMRLFKLNVRHWGNLHAPVASGWPTSAEGKVLSSFQVFDCKSLWRIKIQSCGLTSNYIQCLLRFSFVCARVFVLITFRVGSWRMVTGGGVDGLASAHESYETAGDVSLLEFKRRHLMHKLSDVAMFQQTTPAAFSRLVEMLAFNPKVDVRTKSNYSVCCCVRADSLRCNFTNQQFDFFSSRPEKSCSMREYSQQPCSLVRDV